MKQRSAEAPPDVEIPEPDPSGIVKKPVPEVTTRVAAQACTSGQEKATEAARRTAALRSQLATDRSRGVHPDTGALDRLEAQRAAARLIDRDVSFDQVVEITEKVRDRVSSPSLRTVCQADTHPSCQMRAAFVENLEAPIHLCPSFFSGSKEDRIRTLIHESAHLAGIREDGDVESYCVLFDCNTSCGGFYAADSWAHYVHCVAGEPPDAP